MRRPPLLLLSGWISVAVAAVSVAWIAVRPVAEQRLAELPRVPRPDLVAPPTGTPTSGPSPMGARSASARHSPPRTRPRGVEASRAPRLRTPTPEVSPWHPTSPPPLSTSPHKSPTSPSPSATPDDATLVRKASATGGDAEFAYHPDGEVTLLDATPRDGWDVAAYQIERDWVMVEFAREGHRSTVHAYITEDWRACIEIIEEST